MKRAAISVILLSASLALIAGCGQKEAAGSPPDYKTLASVPADSSSDPELRYALVIEACKDGVCPQAVHLVKGSRVVDSMKLEWPSVSQESEAEPVDAAWGAGDPLGLEQPLSAFATGNEATSVSVAARPVHLDKARTALLVTQRAGWEHLKHHHDLFAVDNGKLNRLWSGAEGPGPTWSSTDVISGPGQSQQILYFSAFQYPNADMPDTLSVTRIAWDTQHKKIVESSVGGYTELQLLVLGNYAAIGPARTAYNRAGGCFTPLMWVLDSRQFPGSGDRFLLGTLTSRPRLASALLDAAKTCTPPLGGKLTAYQEAH
jgi:hypothetical protein